MNAADAEAAVATPHLPQLLTLFSPAFPIGAFAWSHGVEAAVAELRLRNAGDVADWVLLLLEAGSGWNDILLLGEAWRAARAGDAGRLDAVRELAAALAGTSERRAETLALGAAFAEAAAPWLSETAPIGPGAASAANGAEPYPVAAGRLAASAALPLPDVSLAFAHGFAASLVSAAVRLVPLAQSDAVRIMHSLEPHLRRIVERAGAATLDDLGSAAIGSEIAAMRHESLPTRLFRS